MDLIDANEAKALLGCDDATLQNYVNNGTVRAQRVDGKLMIVREDVENLGSASGSDSDDGTIILSGDSEDLSIDLGEVIDDNAATMVQSRDDLNDSQDSITFGDELEVVNFDDGGTEELNFDDSEATASLSFTYSNEAVVTDVDETVVGTATATGTSDFQTVDYGDDDEEDQVGPTRRSVRSQRVRQAPVKTHWIWPTLLILTMLIVAFFVMPFIVMMSVTGEGEYYNGSEKRGTADNMFTGIASALAGFSVEPDKDVFDASNGPDAEWIEINQGDPTQKTGWRYIDYRVDKKRPSVDRAGDFVIRGISYRDDPNGGDPIPNQAVSWDSSDNPNLTFSVKEVALPGQDDAAKKHYQPELRY